MGAAATGVLGWAGRATAADAVQVWGLDPNWGGDPSACACGACAACRSHAANKLFASAAAADAGRAHAYCKCLVVALTRVESSMYHALFVDGGARASVDRRSQWVQAVLAQGPEIAAPQATPLSAPLSPTEIPDSPRVDAVQLTLRRVWITRNASEQRLLNVYVDAPELVNVSLVLSRHGASLARCTINDIIGSRRIKLVIPRHALAGPAIMRIEFTNGAGHTTRITRGIYIPRRY